MRIYAIGDIHGQRAMLETAHEMIARDKDAHGAAGDPVVHLGDLVDRGPDSSGVLDLLIEGLEREENWILLRGNHDAIFLAFLTDGAENDLKAPSGLLWENPRMGGLATLESYGVKQGLLRSRASMREEARGAVPSSHLALLRSMRNFHATPDFFFVHAGIRPGIPITRQEVHDLHWIREPFLSDTRDHGTVVVHGHTPVEQATHYGNRVNLDTGAGMGRPATAAVFEGGQVWALTETGRVPVTCD